ncbi:MAG: DUF3313 family protein [Woeseiaceae bacterium]
MRIAFLVGLSLVVTACAAPNPTVQQGPDAEVSYDGLHRVDDARFKLVYVDPDVDFSRYTKVIPGGAVYEFRTADKHSTQRARSSASEFWISDANRERLEKETSEIFREEVAKSTRFTVTDTRAPDALIIRGALHDIVSYVPPEIVGRGEIYLSSVGEATLIIEGLDSVSGEVIFRVIERRVAETAGNMATMANSVSTWAEVRRLLRRWANTFRQGLDSIPTGSAGS